MSEWFGDLSPVVQAATVCVAAYALGCVSCAYYLTRLMRPGEDIRELGSGNAGATNAGRVLGRQAFLLVMLLDGVKGLLAGLIAQGLHQPPLVLGLVAFFCVSGHAYPAQLGFRGGKGIAPAVGAVLAVTPLLWLAVIGAWLFFLLLLRKFRKSAVLAMIALPVLCVVMKQPAEVLAGYGLMAILLALRSWSGAWKKSASPEAVVSDETH